MNRIGYCCICLGINEGKRKKDHVMVNRGMVKRTFINKGLDYVSDFLFGPQDQTMEEAIKLAHSTWKTKPLTHMSSSKALEDSSKVKTAHADFLYERIEDFGLEFDTEIEAKSKDLAVIKYIKDYGNIGASKG